MTIIEAINRVDKLKPNTYSQLEKFHWLSTLDGRVKVDIFLPDSEDGKDFKGYDKTTPVDTELLIPPPHDEAYIYFLESQIDYWNGEYDNYNNSVTMFNAALDDYKGYYNRTHPSAMRAVFSFGGSAARGMSEEVSPF